jgi:hypothetical protein
MTIFDDKQIDLDLNGPILSFTTNPTGVGSTGVLSGGTGGGSVSLTGIATATFPTSANNTGSIAYQWYEQGVGALSDSTNVTGTATTTLTLSNLITPDDSGRKFFLEADYVPSYYVTGNAINEPLNSGIGTVTVDPLISIVTQPTSRTTIPDRSVVFSVNASLSNEGTDLQYQWQLDGSDVTDGTVTKSTVTEVEGGSRVTQTTQTDDTFTIPANVTDIIFDCAAGSGGNGGGLGGYDAGGVGGGGLAQRFTLSSSTSARTVRFVVGKRGYDGQVGGSGGSGGSGAFTVGGSETVQSGGDGASGGAAGSNVGGFGGGGGGGGGGSTGVYLDGVLVALLGGGGAGGGGGISGTGYDGGSYYAAGGDPGLFPDTSVIGTASGGDGASSNTDAGGGGGGAGTGRLSGSYLSGGFAGTGGSGAGGGNKGDSEYRSDILGLENGTNNPDGNGWSTLIYTDPTTPNIQSVTRTTTISGSTTKSLTLSTDGPGIGYTVTSQVSSVSASNSPLTSNIVNYQVLSELDEAVIVIEAIGANSTATISTIDLNNETDGDVEFSAATVVVGDNILTELFSFYARDRDLDVEMDLFGGGTNSVGGEGGYSRIRFTMNKNEEYVIAGLIDSINTPFVYRKGALMVCVGEGGKGGVVGKSGGDGGGVGVAGGDGFGIEGSGSGGNLIADGQLTLNGTFGSSVTASTVYPGDTQAGNNNGGQTIRCTKGVYWAQQGLAACNDIAAETVAATSKFRLSDGTEVTNTAEIVRGYKAGYNIIQTAGKGITAFRGGNGATGGQGGSGNDAGGGGGSGYSDGTVTVVSTQLGGSTGAAKVVLRIQS